MVKTRSMTRNQNTTDAFSRKRKNTCEDGGGVAWSDLTHDVLHSVMMQLGVVEFISFSGVCKSWRSLALSNKKRFMASRPPMAMLSKNDTWYLQDFEGRKFKTILPNSGDRTCIGVTCGYLIFFGAKTRDFWLVNPITRHELHFPDVPIDFGQLRGKGARAIIVFSPSINGWAFVMIHRCSCQLWFSIAGKGAWNYLSITGIFMDLHAFKGKIYTLIFSSGLGNVYEMRLKPVPKLTSLNTRFLEPALYIDYFIRSDENLYLMQFRPYKGDQIYKLDFDKLNWVLCEKTREEFALFCNDLEHLAAVKRESWAARPSLQYGKFVRTKRGQGGLLYAKLWYFPHDCFNMTRLDE